MTSCSLGNLQLTVKEAKNKTELILFRLTGKRTSLGQEILEEISRFQINGSLEDRREDILYWLSINGAERLIRLFQLMVI